VGGVWVVCGVGMEEGFWRVGLMGRLSSIPSLKVCTFFDNDMGLGSSFRELGVLWIAFGFGDGRLGRCITYGYLVV